VQSESSSNTTPTCSKLVVKGSEAQANRHEQLNQVAQGIRGEGQSYQNQRRIFVTMQTN